MSNSIKYIVALVLLALAGLSQYYRQVYWLVDVAAEESKAALKMEPIPLPSIIQTKDWPPPNTDIFMPRSNNRTSNVYAGFNLVVITICCLADEKHPDPYTSTQAINKEYFLRHGIPFIIFRACEFLGDWERILRAGQVLKHSSSLDFVAWMDCDAGVVAGPEDDAIVNPFDRFLRHFDLFNPLPSRRDAVGMVLSRHVDFSGSRAYTKIGFKRNHCALSNYYPPSTVNDGDCLVNSGVLVIRNNKAGYKAINRFDEVMHWGNISWLQPSYNYILQQQLDSGNRSYPVRVVKGAWFNRKGLPLGFHSEKRKRLTSQDFFRGQWWAKKIPTFIMHPWGYDPRQRKHWWDCALTVTPKSADRIVDQCVHWFLETEKDPGEGSTHYFSSSELPEFSKKESQTADETVADDKEEPQKERKFL
ncbi:expressed unknown protein [Seminavis robusta]|uniref:Uncharacterized protein n=1 Tax=Seminavis robusta TaxID=568900 RepID=A0A9N8H4U2_9STRA|nr:expressed unknown protein [Seminavis robusta]|eukprot:Sro71_g039460.1 n/a (418) ;mRNA; f:84296-85549